MPFNYDPDGRPTLDPRVSQQGLDLGFYPFHVICDEPGSTVGDVGGVSFIAWGNFVPREGERIELQDGTDCQVKSVHYKAAKQPGSELVVLLPNVYAVRISPEPEQ